MNIQRAKSKTQHFPLNKLYLIASEDYQNVLYLYATIQDKTKLQFSISLVMGKLEKNSEGNEMR